MAQWTRNVHFKQLNMHFQTYKIATFAFSNGTETAHLACKSPFSMAQWTIFSNSIFMFRPTRLSNIHFEWYQKCKLQRFWWRCNMHFQLLKMLLKVHFIPNYPPPASVIQLRIFIYQLKLCCKTKILPTWKWVGSTARGVPQQLTSCFRT